jgi:uncharacterized membrane-anchored protein YitT (DUF2179 family)
MKDKKETLFTIIGALFGLIAGYLYYFWVGCKNGCPIKSNPWLMTAYGGIMGGLGTSLIYSLVSKQKNKL